ncbi:MAG: site-2 protease family protein, partial [Candidatus Tectomicrobia bacterium]|nr:site-2 protease family protein [Candidatus Tectomicrobia bacterium]
VAGPLAGFVVALPALMIGLRLSEVRPMLTPLGASLGESLLLKYLVPQVLEIPSESYVVLLHPIAFAAWFGLFVTALNLLPIGQLDGGHIVYALLPQAHKYIALLTIGTLLSIAIMTRWYGWVIFMAITLSLGFRHPPVVEEISSLGLKRRMIGLFALIIFAITFTPVPFPF